MLRLFRINMAGFSSNKHRRQNFFELNPIFPDNAQKDFDIYNVDYRHVNTSKLRVKEQERGYAVMNKLTEDVYLRPIK